MKSDSYTKPNHPCGFMYLGPSLIRSHTEKTVCINVDDRCETEIFWDLTCINVPVRRGSVYTQILEAAQNYYSPCTESWIPSTAENTPENHLENYKNQEYKMSHENSSFLKWRMYCPHEHMEVQNGLRPREEPRRRLWSGCRPARTAAGTPAVCSAAPGCRSAGRRNASSIRRSGRLRSNDARLCWRASRPPANTCETQTQTWAD